MPDHPTNRDFDVQTRQRQVSSLVLDLLVPHATIAEICQKLGFRYRKRVYDPMVVVWMFISQVLSCDHGCQQAVARLNGWRVARGLARVSSETTSYCKARGRLPEALFERLLQWTASRCEEAADQAWLFHGRVVEMVDGWTVTMADTGKNQKEYPQHPAQRAGCGFPLARIVGLFSLATGAVNSFAIGPYQGKQTGETSLLGSIIARVLPGRILLADRYYANFWLLALSEIQGIDLVARAHQLRKVDFRCGLKLGCQDQIVAYRRPQRPAWMSKAEYARYPAIILVRHLRYRVTQKGFRTREITLATTLLDAKVYTAENLADLYRRRWQVELHIRSIKTQMQMEHLRCKSPQSVRKEIHCHLIGYNLVRAIIIASALKYQLSPANLSFTGAMQALEEFATTLRTKAGRQDEHWENLLKSISEIQVGHRPDRTEPREIKRRPKSYKLMTQPRHDARSRANAA